MLHFPSSTCCFIPFFTRIDGEVHHQARYERYPVLVGVGVLPGPHPVQEQLFHTLVGRNAINLHASQHASAVIYRSQPPAAAATALAGVFPIERRVLA